MVRTIVRSVNLDAGFRETKRAFQKAKRRHLVGFFKYVSILIP